MGLGGQLVEDLGAGLAERMRECGRAHTSLEVRGKLPASFIFLKICLCIRWAEPERNLSSLGSLPDGCSS